MKKLILFFLLLSGAAYGQNNNTTNTKFTNGLAVPNGVSQKPTSGLTAGALSYVTGAGLYVYNGSAWVLLGLSSGGVTSFNARTGVVVPEIGDYSSFYVPLTRSLTVNGATQTLAADRTWTITANTPNSLTNGYGITGGVFDGSVARTWVVDTSSVSGLVSKLRLATNLAGYVKKSTTITINGVTQDLSDNRTWTAGTVTSITPGYGLTPQTAITSSGGFAVDTLVLDTVYAKIGAAPTLSFGTFGSTPNAQGGSYSGGVITLQPASASFPGGVTTGPQTWAGNKTFIDTLNGTDIVLSDDLTVFGKAHFGDTIPPSSFANERFLVSLTGDGQMEIGVTGNEAAFAAYNWNPINGASAGKMGVIGFHEGDLNPLTGNYFSEIHTTYYTGGVANDFNVFKGGKDGVVFFPTSHLNTTEFIPETVTIHDGDLKISNDAPKIDMPYVLNENFKHTIIGSGYSATPNLNLLEFKVASGSGTQSTPLTLKGDGTVEDLTVTDRINFTGSGSNISGDGNGLILQSGSNGMLTYINGAYRGIFNGSGNLLIGSLSDHAGERLQVIGDAYVSGSSTIGDLSGSGDIFVVSNTNGKVGKATIGAGLSYTGGVLSATGGGGGGTVTSTGLSAGYIAKGNSSTDIGNSIIQDNGTAVSIGGDLTVTDQVNFTGSGTNIAGDGSGLVITAGTGGVLSYVNGAYRSNLNSSGNLMIGSITDHAGERLQVTGTGYFSGNISAANLSGTNTGDQNLSGYAPLASPALTGNPTAPTQTAGDNSTKIATTAYVDAAALYTKIQTLSASTTLNATHQNVLVNTSGGAVTLTLPLANDSSVWDSANSRGKVYFIKRITSPGNDVTIQPSGSNTIDGSSAYILVSPIYTGVTIQTNGTNWYVISKIN